jgi:hypothetical protein
MTRKKGERSRVETLGPNINLKGRDENQSPWSAFDI